MYCIVSAGRTDVFSFVCGIICDRCGRPPGDHGEKRLSCPGSSSRTTTANLKKQNILSRAAGIKCMSTRLSTFVVIFLIPVGSYNGVGNRPSIQCGIS